MRKIMLAGLAIFGLAAVLAAAAPVDDTGTKVKPDVAPAAAAKTNNLNPSKSNASRHRANPASEIPIEGVEVSLRKWPG